MGSRLVTTQKVPVHASMKQAMVEADERQTTLMFRTLRNTARVFKNQVSMEVTAIEARDGDTDFADLQPLVSGVRGRERCARSTTASGLWA